MNRRSIFINTIFDILALFAAFFIMIWIKPATKRIYLPNYIIPFLIFAFVWVSFSLITQKYSAPEREKLSRAILHIIITNIIISGIATILMFVLRSDFYSRLVFGGIIIIASLIEIFFAICDYSICNASVRPDTSKIFEVYQRVVGRQPDISIEPFPPELTRDPVPENIKNAILEESSLDVFNFLCDNINLNSPDYSLLATTTRFNVNNLPENNYKKIVNLKRINDIRFINKFFESINHKIPVGGIFIGCAETIRERKKRILKKYPPILNRIYYFFDFIVKRIFPKFNLTKRVYYFLTRGENKTISKTEILGRLYSCGFKLINEKEINNLFYFVVTKISEPYFPSNPTYGPIVKLERIGKNGKIIYVYKMRTMHPFAEFIQDYVYDKHGTKDGDKATDDFRVTSWGRMFRKFWIDELPSLYNFAKGDIKIVGVRPLSKSKFNMYPKYLQEKRTKYRPGLVPPFYADMPKSFDEHMESENKYLDAYAKHPLLTDWKYFWKAFWNILFKKARSA